MKKLMIGLVGAAAMVACAEVESGNIVGFNEIGLNFGMKLVSPSFLNVGATDKTFTLADLSVTGLEECWGDVNIQLLDERGRAVVDGEGKTIYYFWQDNEDFDEPGWYDGLDNPIDAAAVAFNAGQGLWIAGAEDSVLHGAGEVNMDNVSVPLRMGMTATGNPFPMAIKLSDIEVSGYDEGNCWGDVNIQLLDSRGRAVVDGEGKTIYYFWQDNEDFDEPGWYDGSDNPVDAEAVTFAVGQGLWVAGMDNAVMTFNASQVQ